MTDRAQTITYIQGRADACRRFAAKDRMGADYFRAAGLIESAVMQLTDEPETGAIDLLERMINAARADGEFLPSQIIAALVGEIHTKLHLEEVPREAEQAFR